MDISTLPSIDTKQLITVWQMFLGEHTWQELIKGREPQFKLGPVIYQIPNPLQRPNESFAIVDMRGLRMEQVSPHYHTNGETEIHFVREGGGLMVIGGKEIQLQKDVVAVVPPDTAHYTVPEGDLILAVVNTPAFSPDNNVGLAELTASDPSVGFDYDQFKRLTTK